MCIGIMKGNMHCKKTEDTISSNMCTQLKIECKLGRSRIFKKAMILYCISPYVCMTLHPTAKHQ
ncbi:hypothetical protein PAHAL_8G175700 [Panicum hallii]|uniref:Uncharacterized protein n=1 Tax=Panicum hallii TaxID=206008 RepID=A0A2T8I995_9POAL|nr:hypothetical protein PAHAL_8G175700 [Panicum hallii]